MFSTELLSRGRRFIKRASSPIWPDKLRRALDQATGSGCDILYVHSRASGIGHFIGGIDWVPTVLREFCGTLVHVTHTYFYPYSQTELAPVFDSKTTPSKVGLLSEAFRQRPDVIRSIHSTHSIAAEGDLAKTLCAKHYDNRTPCGAGTPYSHIVHLKGSALMLGVSFQFYTPFHTVEDESESEFAYLRDEDVRLRFIDESGALQERISRRQNWKASRFGEAGIFLEHRGFVRRVPLGLSELLFIRDMADVHDFLMGRLKKNPDFLRSTCPVELA
jgi:aminoglycoside 3-N-acetyltransferase